MRYLAKMLLMAGVFSACAFNSSGQSVYCFTDAVYDKESKTFLGVSRTSIDYTTALYYDPAVVGTMYQEKLPVSSDTFSTLTTDFSASVLTRSGTNTPENVLYGVYTDHFVVAHFNMQTDGYEPENEAADPAAKPRMKKRWYDFFGFNRYGGAQILGWHIYKGSKWGESIPDSQSYIIGTTYRGALIKLPGQQYE